MKVSDVILLILVARSCIFHAAQKVEFADCDRANCGITVSVHHTAFNTAFHSNPLAKMFVTVSSISGHYPYMLNISKSNVFTILPYLKGLNTILSEACKMRIKMS